MNIGKSVFLSTLLFSCQSFALEANLKVIGRIAPDPYKVVKVENDGLEIEKYNITSSKIEKDLIKLEPKVSFQSRDWGTIEVARMPNIENERYFTIISFGI